MTKRISLRGCAILIAVSSLVGCASSVPSVELVVEVDPESAVGRETERVAVELNAVLQAEGLADVSIVPHAGEIEIRGVASDTRSIFEATLARERPVWRIETTEHSGFRMSAPESVRTTWRDNAFQATLAALDGDDATLGCWKVEAQAVEGSESKLRLRLSGSADRRRIEALINAPPPGVRMREVRYPETDPSPANALPAMFEHDVVAILGGQLPEDTLLVRQEFIGPGATDAAFLFWPAKIVPVAAAREVVRTGVWVNELGDSTVTFDLEDGAGRRNEAMTRRNLGRQILMTREIEGRHEVLAAPKIMVPIGARGLIMGGFELEEAEDLAFRWHLEGLPARLRISDSP